MSSHRLKSMFIMPYMMSMMAMGAWSAYQLASRPPSLGWVGLALATWPFMLWISRLMMFRDRARTSSSLPALVAFGALGAALAMYEAFHQMRLSASALLASAAFIGFLVYDFWYSRLSRQPSAALAVGDVLPKFVLQTPAGKRVESDTWRGHPTLLIFYRGNWCPLCMAQIREIAAQYTRLALHGVKIILVSPQSHAQSAALAKRFEVPFEFLVDVDSSVARQLRIDAPSGVPAGMPGYEADTVMPTVVIADADGRILFCDQTDNYRVRPEPATFESILRDARAIPT